MASQYLFSSALRLFCSKTLLIFSDHLKVYLKLFPTLSLFIILSRYYFFFQLFSEARYLYTSSGTYYILHTEEWHLLFVFVIPRL